MNQDIDFDKMIKINKFWLWAGKIGYLVAFLLLALGIISLSYAILSQPLSVMEFLDDNPKYAFVILLAIPFLLIPFMAVNGHNLAKIKIDYFLQMKAKLDNTPRDREVSDEKITKVVRNGKLIMLGLSSVILLPIALLVIDYFYLLLSGSEIRSEVSIGAPVIVLMSGVIFYIYHKGIQKDDEVILSYREVSMDMPDKSEIDKKIDDLKYKNHLSNVISVVVYLFLVLIVILFAKRIFGYEDTLSLFTEFEPEAIGFVAMLIVAVFLPFGLFEQYSEGKREVEILMEEKESKKDV